LLAEVFVARPKASWLALLEGAKVPCGPINDLAEVFHDPQVQARGMIESWKHPLRPDLKLVASPMKLSATPVQHLSPPPRLGEHTTAVLQDWLGMNQLQVQALQTQQVV
jgi:crotonobetainyl-CoA:carnitine CoA-transferase CaiB-like acyl-CoA transferase